MAIRNRLVYGEIFAQSIHRWCRMIIALEADKTARAQMD